MDQRDRAAIEQLFNKIADVEHRSPPRDPEAERFISALIARQPAAPYYMGQTIVVQEQALNAAQERIEELEERLGASESSGGLFGGLFGSGRAGPRQRYSDRRRDEYDLGPWGSRGGGGFLAGAAQTAMGVAGGVLLGNAISGWLSPDEAAAHDVGGDQASMDDNAGEIDVADAGNFGGDFDLGDF